jgi:zinc metalloprotease ZmpB
MKTRFDRGLGAQVTLDDAGRVRQINHFEQLWEPPTEEKNARDVAAAYIRTIAPMLKVKEAPLEEIDARVSYLAPRKQDVQYRLAEEKTLFDSTTLGYVQTVDNVPVWGAGVTVTVKHAPYRVVNATVTSHDKPKVKKLPSEEKVEEYLSLFATAETERAVLRSARTFRTEGASVAEAAMVAPSESRTAPFIRRILGRESSGGGNGLAGAELAQDSAPDHARMIRGRFFAYRYDPAERMPRMEDFLGDSPSGPAPKVPFPLDPVPASIKPGEYYVVSETTLSYNDPTLGDLNWIALVEVNTDAVLYLRPLAAGVNGFVFQSDPISTSGNASNNATQTNAVLNPLRTSVALQNLVAPSGGVQALAGSRVAMIEIKLPVIAPPTQPTGNDFNFNARSDDFAAVNGYYHSENFFSVLENLGFATAAYFNGTTFPVEVDHRGLGSVVNAHCVGNGTGGIDHCCYALANAASTVGIACDPRVVWHELGGHGVLYEHVNSPNFGFSHSAGDSLAVIFHDPDSIAPDRFLLAPFVPAVPRRFDRPANATWRWGGSNDVGGYTSEEILATTLFRLYRAIGGDSTDLARRRFASRAAMYLVLRTIGTLTPMTNPGPAGGPGAQQFANSMMAVDLLNWTSEGIDGGAYNKVIRWSFEKQGLYGGLPPAVDVYIDDGRAGEYQYQPVHWNTTTIWNRNAADGLTAHQNPILGQPNFVYVRVKNRGTSTANNVVVKGFHCKPGAGLLWPNDLQAMTTAQLPAGSILGNNAQEKIVGPFQWTPITNAFGHDCLLMIASATGDPANTTHFTAGESIPEWRLVPNDNNIAQRNVNVVAGGGGLKSILKALANQVFRIGNPNPRKSVMEIRVNPPEELVKLGLKVKVDAEKRFILASGEKRDVKISVSGLKDFTSAPITKLRNRDVLIELVADGIVIGGMTYRIDPKLK